MDTGISKTPENNREIFDKRIVIAAVIIIAVLGFYFFISHDELDAVDLEVDALQSNNARVISATELSLHSIEKDCWVAYNGKVYDVTEWLPQHPGSADAIIPYCGTAEEFETAFTNQHGTTKASLLMKVGVLMGDFKVAGEME